MAPASLPGVIATMSIHALARCVRGMDNDVGELDAALQRLNSASAEVAHAARALAMRRTRLAITEEDMTAIASVQREKARKRATAFLGQAKAAVDSLALEKEKAEAERAALASEVRQEVDERVAAVETAARTRESAAEAEIKRVQGAIVTLDRKLAAVKANLKEAKSAMYSGEGGLLDDAQLARVEEAALREADATTSELSEQEERLASARAELARLEREAMSLDDALAEAGTQAGAGSGEASDGGAAAPTVGSSTPSMPSASKRQRSVGGGDDGSDAVEAEELRASVARLEKQRDLLRAAFALSPAKPSVASVHEDIAESKAAAEAALGTATSRKDAAMERFETASKQVDSLMDVIAGSKPVGTAAATILRSLVRRGAGVPAGQGELRDELQHEFLFERALAVLAESDVVRVDGDQASLVAFDDDA